MEDVLNINEWIHTKKSQDQFKILYMNPHETYIIQAVRRLKDASAFFVGEHVSLSGSLFHVNKYKIIGFDGDNVNVQLYLFRDDERGIFLKMEINELENNVMVTK